MRIEVKDVEKRFGDALVLRGVSLGLESGGLNCLVGPSGSGKTTLMRIMAMLDSQDSGTITYDGVQGDDCVHQKVVMVLQKPVVFKRTVYENVAYGLRIRDTASEEIEDRVANALGVVNLGGFEDRWAPSLSGGEQQRVAFARAIVVEPSLLLLDEFTANLDPANIEILERQVRDFRDGGGAVAMVTHSVQQGRRLADKLCLLLDGRIVETAGTEKFFESPATPEARDFVSGKMVW